MANCNRGVPAGPQTAQTPRTPQAADTSDVGGLQVGTATDGGRVSDPTNGFASAGRVTTAMNYADVPDNSACEAVWSRDGVEITRSTRQIGGTGWVSFELNGAGGSLQAGEYTVTVTIGQQVVGRKSFAIGE